jgi:hypothetical protein
MRAPDLDQFASRVRHGPGFDVSPGAIAPRPDPELDAMMGELDADAVPALRERLEREADPFLAHTWLRALRRIGGAEAEAAIDGYVSSIRQRDPWAGGFPGAGELLALLNLPPR